MPHAASRSPKFLLSIAAAAVSLGLWSTTSAWAQAFPNQPIRIIVGSEPGSAPDVLARTLAKEMEPLIKQTLVIENKPGAAGTLGATLTAQAQPDGYTLLMGTVSNIALAPTFYNVKYKPTESFTPVGLVAAVPLVLVSSAASGLDTFAALRQSLTNPQAASKLSYASPGNGGPQHLAGVLLARQFGQPLLHVPYKSGGAAMTSVASGETSMAFAGIPAAIPLLQGKRVVPMFVTAAKRSPALPDVPSAVEVGLPAFEVDNWHALMAPAGLSPDVRARLEDALRQALRSPALQAEFLRLGAEATPSTGAELAAKVAREEQRWAAVAREAGLHQEKGK